MNLKQKISWKGVLVAPLLVPFLANVLLSCSTKSQHPVLAFIVFFILGCIVSYAVTVFLFLPWLVALSWVMRVPWWLTCLLGTLLGVALFFPVTYQSWMSSGSDSGPPEVPFRQYLARDLASGELWGFAVAGLLTAAVYAFYARRMSRETAPSVSEDPRTMKRS